MDCETFQLKIEAALSRVASLDVDAALHPVVQDAVEQLSATLDELRAADDELRRQQAELEAAHQSSEAALQKYRTLFDSAPFGYLCTDRDGIITDANEQVLRLLNRERCRLIGRPLAAFIATPDRYRFRANLGRLIENPGREEWETRIVPTGSRVTVSVSIAAQAAPTDDGPGAFLWVIKDLRELRRAQAEALQAREQAWGHVMRHTAALEIENRSLKDEVRLQRGLGQEGPVVSN